MTKDAIPAGAYVVQEGDCLSSIADRSGHFWQTLWDLPENATLKSARPGPNILLAGDVVTVPPLRQKQAAAATGRSHRFRRKGVPSFLRLRFEWGTTPRAGESFAVSIDDAPPVTGKLDGDGALCIPIPPTAGSALVTVGDGEMRREYTVDLGRLEPITQLRGVQQRLNNLGHACGAANGVAGPDTDGALRRFQEAAGLTADGVLDDETRNKLVEIHGS